jgi:hypothetical protein
MIVTIKLLTAIQQPYCMQFPCFLGVYIICYIQSVYVAVDGITRPVSSWFNSNQVVWTQLLCLMGRWYLFLCCL